MLKRMFLGKSVYNLSKDELDSIEYKKQSDELLSLFPGNSLEVLDSFFKSDEKHIINLLKENGKFKEMNSIIDKNFSTGLKEFIMYVKQNELSKLPSAKIKGTWLGKVIDVIWLFPYLLALILIPLFLIKILMFVGMLVIQ